MEVINKKFYTCSICGRTSVKEDRIKDCEQSHIGIDQNAAIHAEYNKSGTLYPAMLGVPMENGKIAWYQYRFDKEVQSNG